MPGGVQLGGVVKEFSDFNDSKGTGVVCVDAIAAALGLK